MTHEFLLHLHRRSGLIEPGTIGVAERMPPDSFLEADELRNPFELPLAQTLLVERLPCPRIGECPILVLGIAW